MKTADVIIGANFGDEGKGLMTDYHAAKAGDAIVARFNGGAQAGHTVTAPDGRRHIFSHIGSGVFAGAETLLSRFFVCNPLLFRKEHDVLKAQADIPALHVDARALVSTPYDMMINQIAEDLRGNGRHGSCGMGFGETIERCLNTPLALTYADLADKGALKEKLRLIRTEWLPKRLEKLGFPDMSEKWQERVNSDGLLEKFVEDTEFFLNVTQEAASDFLAKAKNRIVFEGAQGLMLDQKRGIFPHVTRSHTGLKNALALAKDAGIEDLDVTYATRAYQTRHGAGPLGHELPDAPYAKIRDATNVKNDWQGQLRFAWLDVSLTAKYILDDLEDTKDSGVNVRHGLAVTCLDQTGDEVTFVVNDEKKTARQGVLLDALKSAVSPAFMLESHGPSRDTVADGRKAAA